MLNSCSFIGRLGQDPETRHTQSGNEVCNFSIACDHKYKGETTTEWVRIVAFGKLAEICGQYLTKGSLVYINGRMQTRKWQDKDGNDKYSTEIIANEMKMLDSRGEGKPQQATQQQEPAQDDFDDDIPFIFVIGAPFVGSLISFLWSVPSV